MAPKGVIILALVALLAQYAAGQLGGFQFGFPGRPFVNPFRRRPIEYFTCIGKNNYKDEVRITFRTAENRAWWNPQESLQMDAYVSLGQGSPIQGEYQLLLTQYSHVEDGCRGNAMGRVIDERPLWLRQQGQETGVLGSPFRFSVDQRIVNTNVELRALQDLRMVNGRGIIMCPRWGYNAGTCRGAIPLCCKCGRDSMNATSVLQQISPNQMGGMGGQMGGQMGGGMPGGMPGGMGGMPGGMGGMGGTGALPGGGQNPPPSLPFKKK